jgi:hypothetical protein
VTRNLNLQSIVEESLGVAMLEDRVFTRNGWVCFRTTDYISSPRWGVSFNHPLEIDEWAFISQFIRGAHDGTVQSIYRSCNGVRIGHNEFCIPGVRLHSALNKGEDFFNIPYGFDVMGGLSLPPLTPVNGFLAGASHLHATGQPTRKFYDVVDEKGIIISGFFDDSPNVLESFQSVEGWFAARIGQAITRLNRARPGSLN